MALSLSSQAFRQGERIPARYTCQGEDISPPLAWSEAPAGTRTLALIMDDPDAPGGVFTHWVIFNMPPERRQLPEAVPAELPDALQGRTDFGSNGYRGPCPPPGSPHHYRFILYALDQQLELLAGSSKKQAIDAMKEHILGQGQLLGTYQR